MQQFVYAYIFFPANAILISVLFVHVYLIYPTLASGSQEICILSKSKTNKKKETKLFSDR